MSEDRRDPFGSERGRIYSGNKAAPQSVGQRAGGGFVRKGYLSVPSGDELRSVTSYSVLNIPAAVQRAKAKCRAQALDAARARARTMPEHPRRVVAIVLAWPCASPLRDALRSLSTHIDASTGGCVQIASIDDPAWTKPHGLAFAESCGLNARALDEAWQRAQAGRAGADDAIAVANAAYASQFGIAIDELPAVALLVTGDESSACHVSLRKVLEPGGATPREVIERIVTHLAPAMFAEFLERPHELRRRFDQSVSAIHDTIGELMSERAPVATGQRTRHRRVPAIEKGWITARQVEERYGVARSTLQGVETELGSDTRVDEDAKVRVYREAALVAALQKRGLIR